MFSQGQLTLFSNGFLWDTIFWHEEQTTAYPIHSLDQLIPYQMGSSQTPICCMKTTLRLSPLTLSG